MNAKSIVMASVLVFSLAACAGAPAATPTPSAPQVVNVSLTDYGFKFTPDKIKPGEVKFMVKNEAKDMMHEMFLVKTALAVDKLPIATDGSGNIDEESKDFTKLGVVEDIDPGKSGELTVKLDAGHYIYFCNKPGHYKLGMRGELTVAP